VRDRLAAALKSGLDRTGYYARVLARSAFPGVAVLGYHGLRSDDCPAESMAFENLHVRASTFDDHCRLVSQSCDPIALDDWRDALDGRTRLPARPVLITFDDGYRSVFTIGAPILAAHRLPAVVFACSEPMERRRLLWFDAVAARKGESAVESWKARDYESFLAGPASHESCAAVSEDDPRALMTQADVAALSRQHGIEIGAHTARHPILSRAAPAAQRIEIAESRDVLERWIGAPVRAFAYPNGRPQVDYSQETVDIVRELRFDFAFTMRQAFATPEEPPLERSRFLMLSELTSTELAHRLAYSWRASAPASQ
jgi:peptidoglycan/xylan/chitin deacetylase (PgdA/CDA1 family)